MFLRILIAALAIWGMTWSKDANAAAQSNGCRWYNFFVDGAFNYSMYICDGNDGGGGGSGYEPPPIYGGGGGLPSRSGYAIHEGFYVKEDGSEVDASHLYSCETLLETRQDVVQLALLENSMIPRYGEVMLRLSNGSQVWTRIGIGGPDQFEPSLDSNCE